MGAGVHVGIHAYREARGLAKMSGARAQELQLAGAFDIEQQNAGAQREVDFVGELADSREDDFARAICGWRAARAGVRRRRRCRIRCQAKPAAEGSRGSSWPSRSNRWCVRRRRRPRQTAGNARGSRWRNKRRAECRSVRRVGEGNLVGEKFAPDCGPRAFVPAVGEGGRAFLRTRVAHFLAGVPFTLSTTMV